MRSAPRSDAHDSAASSSAPPTPDRRRLGCTATSRSDATRVPSTSRPTPTATTPAPSSVTEHHSGMVVAGRQQLVGGEVVVGRGHGDQSRQLLDPLGSPLLQRRPPSAAGRSPHPLDARCRSSSRLLPAGRARRRHAYRPGATGPTSRRARLRRWSSAQRCEVDGWRSWSSPSSPGRASPRPANPRRTPSRRSPSVDFEPRLVVTVDDGGISGEPGDRDGAEISTDDDGRVDACPSGSVVELLNDATDARRVVVTVSPFPEAPDDEPAPWVDSGAMEPGESTVLGLTATGVYRFDDAPEPRRPGRTGPSLAVRRRPSPSVPAPPRPVMEGFSETHFMTVRRRPGRCEDGSEPTGGTVRLITYRTEDGTRAGVVRGTEVTPLACPDVGAVLAAAEAAEMTAVDAVDSGVCATAARSRRAGHASTSPRWSQPRQGPVRRPELPAPHPRDGPRGARPPHALQQVGRHPPRPPRRPRGPARGRACSTGRSSS